MGAANKAIKLATHRQQLNQQLRTILGQYHIKNACKEGQYKVQASQTWTKYPTHTAEKDKLQHSHWHRTGKV